MFRYSKLNVCRQKTRIIKMSVEKLQPPKTVAHGMLEAIRELRHSLARDVVDTQQCMVYLHFLHFLFVQVVSSNIEVMLYMILASTTASQSVFWLHMVINNNNNIGCSLFCLLGILCRETLIICAYVVNSAAVAAEWSRGSPLQ